jgi:hypothetical protein
MANDSSTKPVGADKGSLVCSPAMGQPHRSAKNGNDHGFPASQLNRAKQKRPGISSTGRKSAGYKAKTLCKKEMALTRLMAL